MEAEAMVFPRGGPNFGRFSVWGCERIGNGGLGIGTSKSFYNVYSMEYSLYSIFYCTLPELTGT